MLGILSFVYGAERDEQRRSLLQLKIGRLVLLARHWKCPLQLITCQGDANKSNSTMENKYMFAALLLFQGVEGDEATSPSCVAENRSIDASSSLLEAPIGTYHRRRGCKQE